MKIVLTPEQYRSIMNEYQKRFNERHNVRVFSYYLNEVFKEENNCQVKLVRENNRFGGMVEHYELTFNREEEYTWFKLRWD